MNKQEEIIFNYYRNISEMTEKELTEFEAKLFLSKEDMERNVFDEVLKCVDTVKEYFRKRNEHSVMAVCADVEYEN